MKDHVYLKSTWDREIKIDGYAENHVIRGHEHDKLTDFISRREEGSLLVCGNRGVGKTSVVVQAINDARSKNKKIVTAKIDATGKYTPSPKKPKSLIPELIRSFYKATSGIDGIDKETKECIAELYVHSQASKTYGERKLTRTKTFERLLSLKFGGLLGISLVSISALGFLLDEIPQWIGLIVLLLYAFFYPLASLRYKLRSSHSESASYYYRYDYDDAKRMSSLKTILSNIKSHKILFVVDELDKVTDSQKVLLELKTYPLINHGGALFIFISDPDILANLNKKESENYTLFSQKLFIKRPLFAEMDDFLERIVDWGDDKPEQSYKDFMNYISYVSHTDFFEIYNLIRDRATSMDDKKRPTLSILLDDAMRRKSVCQKAIRWTYERRAKKNPSEWRDNDKMLDSLYAVTECLETYTINNQVTINENAIKFSNKPDISGPPLAMQAIGDLFYYFSKAGYLREVDGKNFVYTGDLRAIDPETEGVLGKEQELFNETFQEWVKTAISYGNKYNKWQHDLAEIFKSDTLNRKWDELVHVLDPIVAIGGLELHKNLFYEKSSRSLYGYNTDQIQSMTNDIRSTKDLLVSESYYGLARITLT